MFAERFAAGREGEKEERDSEIATGDPDEVRSLSLSAKWALSCGRSFPERKKRIDFANLLDGAQIWENVRKSCGHNSRYNSRYPTGSSTLKTGKLSQA
jgi:hypothetical protein